MVTKYKLIPGNEFEACRVSFT